MNQERSILAAASVLCPALYRILNSCNNDHHIKHNGESLLVIDKPITVVLCCRLCRAGGRAGPHTTTITQSHNLPWVTRAGAHRRGEWWKDSGGRDRQHCWVERQTTEETAPLSVSQVSLCLVVVCNVSIVYCIEAVSKMSRHFSHQA